VLILAGALAVAVGAAINPYVGLAVVAITALSALTFGGVHPLLALMLVAVFFELVQFGGATLTRLVAPLALVALVLEVSRRGTGLVWNGLLVSVFAYATWAIASGMWTVDTEATLYLLQSLAIAVVFMLSFAILLTNERQLTRTLYFMIACSVVVGMIAIGAFMGVLSFNILLQGGRAQGGSGDPNFFANVQLVALPLAIVLAGDARAKFTRYALLFAVLVVLASILVSLSRGGFIAAIFQMVVLMAIRPTRLFRSRRDKKLLLLVLALGFAFIMSGETLRGDVVKRFESIFTPSEEDTGSANGSGREMIWAGAELSISERPMLGLGYGAFASSSTDLITRTPNIDLTHFELREGGIEVHNVYLSTAAELGYTGLVFFIGMLVSMLVLNRQTARRARASDALLVGRLATALCVSLVGWAISSIFISTETSRPLWIMFGLSLALSKLANAPRQPDSYAPRSAYEPVGLARSR
jgi:O-antigen ligase